jgi:hypothetical protein
MALNFNLQLNFYPRKNLTKKQLLFPLFLLLATSSPMSWAQSISLGYEKLTQYITVLDKQVAVNPAGKTLAASFDLSEQWQLSIDYQNYKEDDSSRNRIDSSIDLSTLGAGINYYLNDFSFALYYSRSKDDILVVDKQNSLNRQIEKSNSSIISGTVDYAWDSQNWFYDISLTAQYNSFDSSTELVRNISSSTMSDHNTVMDSSLVNYSGNYSTLSSGFLLAHLWSLAENRNLVIGGLLNWSYQLAGDSQALTRNTRRFNNSSTRMRTRVNAGGGSGINNALTGDENYGQLVIYSSYDLTPAWSLDFDVVKNVATQNNEQSYSTSITYSF